MDPEKEYLISDCYLLIHTVSFPQSKLRFDVED